MVEATMPRPRKALVCRADTPYYHCVSRCVRRAFLCGTDRVTGHCYEHRRQWIVERLHRVASLFAIDICAYAIMSNHYHLVLRLGSAEAWSDEEVIDRWLALHRGPLLVRQWREGRALNAAQRQTVGEIVRVWRHRLQDLSWFMKCLNEPIARQANAEDDCTGHFWESRFKSQALRTEQALLACMAYVDLNPVRAGGAETLEGSDYTSVQARLDPAVSPRLRAAIQRLRPALPACATAATLLPFADASTPDHGPSLPCSLRAYLELLEWTGRQVRPDKRGVMGGRRPPLLQRLAVDPDQWLIDSQRFEEIHFRRFGRAA
jgi:REP element-mobilizing transposase RayT